MGKPVYVRVRGPNPLFINSTLLAPGDHTWVDLDDLGMTAADLKASKILERASPEDGAEVADDTLARDPAVAAVALGGETHGQALPVIPDDADVGHGDGTLEPEPPVRRETAGDAVEAESAAVDQLMRNNTEAKLRNLAASEKVTGVTEDDDKIDIARKIVTARRGKGA